MSETNRQKDENVSGEHSPAEQVQTHSDNGAALDHGSSPAVTPGSSGDIVMSQAEFSEMQSDLDRFRKEAADNYDRYVRLAAELENHRRRSEKEKSDLRKFGVESFVKSLLPVLDSFDRATVEMDASRGDANDSGASLEEGVSMIRKLLFETLEKQGVSAVEAVGNPFDPRVHQAIRRVENSDIKEETVMEEYSKGYLLNDRLIRPAVVSVAVPAAN